MKVSYCAALKRAGSAYACQNLATIVSFGAVFSTGARCQWHGGEKTNRCIGFGPDLSACAKNWRHMYMRWVPVPSWRSANHQAASIAPARRVWGWEMPCLGKWLPCLAFTRACMKLYGNPFFFLDSFVFLYTFVHIVFFRLFS